ncbi:MAG: PqqD family protein [Oscillospiraceae bacterium]|nr:PqqD family protein [Oscillospiraceae bacterium]
MKLSSSFITYITQEESLMVASNTRVFSGLVRGNSSAGFILECLKQETTLDEIADRMAEKYDAPREQLYLDAKNIVDQLRSIHAIED